MSAKKTKLTKTGQPVLGTTIEVSLIDGTWEAAKVVGKLNGQRGGGHLIGVILEWEDGTRQPMYAVDGDEFARNIGDTWRAVEAPAVGDPPALCVFLIEPVEHRRCGLREDDEMHDPLSSSIASRMGGHPFQPQSSGDDVYASGGSNRTEQPPATGDRERSR